MRVPILVNFQALEGDGRTQGDGARLSQGHLSVSQPTDRKKEEIKLKQQMSKQGLKMINIILFHMKVQNSISGAVHQMALVCQSISYLLHRVAKHSKGQFHQS